MRTILYTGKGGVGKTTLSAATALYSASLGYRTLVISTDIAHSLADALDIELDNEPRPVGIPNLWAAELDTAEELERYWGDVRRRIASALRDEGISAPAAGELAILPGLDEVLALVRIKRYCDSAPPDGADSEAPETGGRYDVLIIDSAPTGAAMRLLSAPDLQRWYTRHLVGLSRGLARMIMPTLRAMIRLPVSETVIQERISGLFDQVNELRAILTDPEQTSVRLVLNPDHMSLRETRRAYTYMSLFGLSVDALFVNRILPDEVSDPFFQGWKEDQATYRQEIVETFAPLKVFEVPLLRSEVVGLDALEGMAAQLFAEPGSDPIKPLSTELPLRFYMEDGRNMLDLRVTGIASGAVDLEKRGDELRVRLGRFRRSLILPQSLAGLQPVWAQVQDGHLRIAFDEPGKAAS